MEAVEYGRSLAGGTVALPPSKSTAHRLLIGAALSGRPAAVEPIDLSRDMEATLGVLEALGARTAYDPAARRATLDGSGLGAGHGQALNCLESGSTLRFLLPVAAALGGEWTFTGEGRLPQRPLGAYRELFPAHGVEVTSGGSELPLRLSGRLTPGRYELAGNVSSQFITGLLLALPLLGGDSEIALTTPLESAGYVNITRACLERFGVEVRATAAGWQVPGGQRYAAPPAVTVEGDWSQAAFFLALAALDPEGQEIRLTGLNRESVQGDRACVEAFAGFGLEAAWDGDVLTARNPRAGQPFGGLHGREIDAGQIPDMVPALAVTAALARGETRIVHAGRLRLKESDRLAAMEEALTALGGKVAATAEGLVIRGVEELAGGTAPGANDHRVVMALAAAGLRSRSPVRVTDPRSIEKSYPGFFRDLNKIGGSAHVVQLG